MHKYVLCFFCLTAALRGARAAVGGARLTFIVGGTLAHGARAVCDITHARTNGDRRRAGAERGHGNAERGSGTGGGWKLKRNFQNGGRKLPRGTRSADRLGRIGSVRSGSRRARRVEVKKKLPKRRAETSTRSQNGGLFERFADRGARIGERGSGIGERGSVPINTGSLATDRGSGSGTF